MELDYQGAEGELFVDMMRDNAVRVKLFKENPSLKRLLVRMYVIAEAWAQSKGVELADIEVINPKLAGDDRHFFWDFRIRDDAQPAKQSLGILDMNGEVIR